MSDTAVEDVEETAEEPVGGNGSSGMAKKLLIPAAAGVGTLAATVAAKKAPDLFRDKVLPLLEDKGSDEAEKMGKQAASKLGNQGGILGAVASKATGGGGGGGGGGRPKTRRLPIQRWTDISVPVPDAYEKWTQFEEFPKFMHRVLNVEQADDQHVKWDEKIWFSKREWEGEITDRRKNDRIAWKTTKGTSHKGVVSFHKLDTNLTRVLVTMDFQPGGMMEKMASGLRFVKRAVEADLARFKTYCEFENAKGLEYAQPGELQEGDEEKEDQKGEGGKNGRQQSGTNGGGDGDASQSSANSEGRDQSRQERAERREERRAS
jgi:Polyketide cyclase / dehydrase and lipid transport